MLPLISNFGFVAFLVCALSIPTSVSVAGGPDTLSIGNSTLQKNGAGYRKKSFLTLYEGALYLTQKSQDANRIIVADAPMAMRLQIQSGFVSQSKMLAALEDGFKNATNGNLGSISTQIQQFRKCFSEPIEKDDVFVIAYLPESGVTVYKNGKMKGTIAGIEFKKAVFGIWLSNNPADSGLKSALLGR